MSRDAYRDDIPTRAEADADRRESPAGWNLSTPEETARWHALRAANARIRAGVDNTQH